MQKILFVSIILIIGLFSLQWSLTHSARKYYTSEQEPVLEVQPVQYHDQLYDLDAYNMHVDSLGNIYLIKKQVPISL